MIFSYFTIKIKAAGIFMKSNREKVGDGPQIHKDNLAFLLLFLFFQLLNAI